MEALRLRKTHGAGTGRPVGWRKQLMSMPGASRSPTPVARSGARRPLSIARRPLPVAATAGVQMADVIGDETLSKIKRPTYSRAARRPSPPA